jgi:cytochrome c oxidase subunit 2
VQHGKGWSILFGAVAGAAVLLFVVSPFVGWWLPRDVSWWGADVDFLFYLILGITGFFFILTEAILVYFMYTYAGLPPGAEQPVGHHYAEKKVFWTTFFKRIARPVTAVIHNQHRLELFWTAVPAAILLFIAFAQVSTWADIKYHARMPIPDQILEVRARQFEWRMRYPTEKTSAELLAGWKAGVPTEASRLWVKTWRWDDIHVVSEIHTWQRAHVRVELKTDDVIHSFYLPNLRLKQDALPGRTIPVWFQPAVKDPSVSVANTRRIEETTTEARPPDNEHHWMLPNDDKTDGRYHWVRWEDGYDPDKKLANQPGQVWDLACAELCGWGHYKMHGRLYVHENEQDYRDWLRAAEHETHRTRPEPTTPPAK